MSAEERPRSAEPRAWSPDHYMRLIALGTSSLCMLAIVGVILIGVVNGTLSTNLLGDYKTGAGLIGVLIVLYLVIKKALG